MVEIELLALRDDLPSGAPVLWLRQIGASRVLPITIGGREAESIGWELEGIEFPRPMTHDLLRSVVEDLGAEVTAVHITHVDNGTFFADLLLRQGERTITVSARPSDAVALALRADAPLYADETVLDQAGVDLEETEAPDDEVLDEGRMVEEFREFLDAVQPEDFAP